MSSFIRSVLEKNAFNVKIVVRIDGLTFIARAKIDTGCSISTLVYKTITNADDKRRLECKKKAIDEGLKTLLGFGVNDTVNGREAQISLWKSGDILNCTAVKFKYPSVELSLDDCSFVHDICVSYDRDGSSLIGMDILKDFDFHCGESLKTGEFIFLGCLRSKICSDYTKALREELGIVFEHEFLAKVVREGI